MKLPLALVLASLALAGCFSEEPVESASACEGAATASAGGASASATCDGASASAGGSSASATSSGASASAGAESASATDGAAVTRTTVPFSAQGSTTNGAGLCAPPMGCTGQDLPGEGENAFEVDLRGALVGAELTMTWSAATPVSEELTLGVAYETEEGNADWLTASGPSPLTLSLTGITIPADKVIAVYANGYRCEGQVVFFGCASAEQSFSIEGSLTTESSA